MGEVIEISIISKDENLLMKLLSFISLQIKDDTTKKIIEVMDNWQYENVEKIESIELAEAFIGNKIVCITEENANGQVGVHIEPIADLLLYNMWFSLEGLLSDAEYAKLIGKYLGLPEEDLKKAICESYQEQGFDCKTFDDIPLKEMEEAISDCCEAAGLKFENFDDILRQL